MSVESNRKFIVWVLVVVGFLGYFLWRIDAHIGTLLKPEKEIVIKEVKEPSTFSDSVRQHYEMVSCTFNNDTAYRVDSMRREMLLNITPTIHVTPQVSVVTQTDTPICSHKDFKEAYDLFDKHFNILLVIMGILITVFGLLIPITSYLFQRMSLKEERDDLNKKMDKYEDQMIKKMEEKLNENVGKANEALKKEIQEASNKSKESEKDLSKIMANVYLNLGINMDSSNLNAKLIYCMNALELLVKYIDNNDFHRSIDNVLLAIYELLHPPYRIKESNWDSLLSKILESKDLDDAIKIKADAIQKAMSA